MIGRTEVVRVGTGPAHLARNCRTGYRLACGRIVSADRVTVMGRRAWLTTRFWRHCDRCKARAMRATSDAQLFAQ